MANTITSDDVEYESALDRYPKAVTSRGSAHLVRSVIARFTRSRQRRLDAEIGRFIADHGGKLTDDIERQISRRFGTHSG